MIKHPMPFAERFIMGLASIADYLRLSFFPVGLHMEYRVPPVLENFVTYYLPRIVVTISFAVLAYYFWRRGKKDVNFRIAFFGAGFFLLALFPYLDIAFQLNAPFSEHWLYIPMMGILLSIVYTAFYKFGKGYGIETLVFFAAVTGIFILVTIRQNEVWKDEITFCKYTIKHAPHSANAYNMLALKYINQGKLPEAKGLLLKAIRVDADYEFAHVNLRKLESRLPAGASADRAETTQASPRERCLMLNKEGVDYGQAGYLDEALLCFEKAIQADPDFAESYNSAGFAYYKKGDLVKASEYFKKALKADPDYAQARLNLDSVQQQIDNKRDHH